LVTILGRRKLLQIGALAAGALVGVYGASSASEKGSDEMNTDPMTQLKALNARFIHNFVTNDVKSHSAMMHERFVNISSLGQRISREDYLKRWATGFDPKVIVYWDYRDEKISIFGNVGLVSSTNKRIVRRDGVETVGMTTYTDTYLDENGEWKCIQAQITTVAPEHYPGDETIVRKYIMGQIQE
jgi:hypothetical protein